MRNNILSKKNERVKKVFLKYVTFLTWLVYFKIYSKFVINNAKSVIKTEMLQIIFSGLIYKEYREL